MSDFRIEEPSVPLGEVFDDPRVRKLCGVPTWAIDLGGEDYLVTEVPAGMYGGGRPGYAVFGPDRFWLGDHEPRPGEPDARQIYPTADEAVRRVLAGPVPAVTCTADPAERTVTDYLTGGTR